jgi:hypothetical protein
MQLMTICNNLSKGRIEMSDKSEVCSVAPQYPSSKPSAQSDKKSSVRQASLQILALGWKEDPGF